MLCLVIMGLRFHLTISPTINPLQIKRKTKSFLSIFLNSFNFYLFLPLFFSIFQEQQNGLRMPKYTNLCQVCDPRVENPHSLHWCWHLFWASDYYFHNKIDKRQYNNIRLFQIKLICENENDKSRMIKSESLMLSSVRRAMKCK